MSESRYIVVEKECCGTCTHYRQHYILSDQGRPWPLWYGHCVVPRLKRREPDENCPYWKSVELAEQSEQYAWAKSALTEGLEESVQSAVSGATEKLFFDKEKPMVSLSDRSAVINPGRMAEEFAAGAAVGGILGAGQLAGNRLAAADPMVRARKGDYSGLMQELDDHIRAKKRNEFLVAYNKYTGTPSLRVRETIENAEKDDIITSFHIGKSVGASAKNYPVKMPDSKQRVKLAEGQTVEGKAFAGKGTGTEIKDRFRLEATYRIPTHEWQKMSGNAYVVIDGKRKKAEIHWYSAKGKNFEMKVKRYFDED